MGKDFPAKAPVGRMVELVFSNFPASHAEKHGFGTGKLDNVCTPRVDRLGGFHAFHPYNGVEQAVAYNQNLFFITAGSRVFGNLRISAIVQLFHFITFISPYLSSFYPYLPYLYSSYLYSPLYVFAFYLYLPFICLLSAFYIFTTQHRYVYHLLSVGLPFAFCRFTVAFCMFTDCLSSTWYSFSTF